MSRRETAPTTMLAPFSLPAYLSRQRIISIGCETRRRSLTQLHFDAVDITQHPQLSNTPVTDPKERGTNPSNFLPRRGDIKKLSLMLPFE